MSFMFRIIRPVLYYSSVFLVEIEARSEVYDEERTTYPLDSSQQISSVHSIPQVTYSWAFPGGWSTSDELPH